MATAKQKKALENMAENGGNVSKAMRDAGYSPQTAKTPAKLLDSVGFMKLMDEKGLTDSLIIESLVEDIKTKKGNRTSELTLAVKMRGRITDRVDLTGEVEHKFEDLTDEQLERAIQERKDRAA